jgi:putative endonuclease
VKRVYLHRQKLMYGFSSKYNLSKLVYYEELEDISYAIKREKQLKNLLRRKKDDLITNFNSNWKDLYSELV